MKHYGSCGGELVRVDKPTHFIYGCKSCGHIWKKRRKGIPKRAERHGINDVNVNDQIGYAKANKMMIHTKRDCMGEVVKTTEPGVVHYTCLKCNKKWDQRTLVAKPEIRQVPTNETNSHLLRDFIVEGHDKLDNGEFKLPWE